jgi:hypothetical protein
MIPPRTRSVANSCSPGAKRRMPKLGALALLLLIASGCGGSTPDGTPPTVTSRTPAPGAGNISVNAPVAATFSEALAVSSLSGSSVAVSDGSGALLARTLALSDDGKTLTVELVSKPNLPNTLTVALTGSLTDSTGTPLIVPADEWSFTLPEWLELGGALSANDGSTAAFRPSMALDDAGNPVVAWDEFDGMTFNIHVQRWTGSDWSPVGSGMLSANSGSTGAVRPSLALDGDGNPTVAWDESDGTNRNIYVQRWTGSGWSPVGPGVLSANTGDTDAFHASLALTGSGDPVVAWHEEESGIENVYVHRWTGTGWVPVGPGLLSANGGATAAQEPSLALDPAGNPVVAWHEYDGETINIHVQRWNGSSWSGVGGLLSANLIAEPEPDNTHAFEASLALDEAGEPMVAWREFDGSAYNIYVRRWNGSNWSSVGLGRLSASDSPTSAIRPSLALYDGDPVVAWEESGESTTDVHVRRWNGDDWTEVGSGMLSALDGATAARGPSLALAASGEAVVAWQEGDGIADGVFVRRENR